MDKPNLELILVVGVMALIFLFGLVVVAVFFRTWRRERDVKRTDAATSDEPRSDDTVKPRSGGRR